LTLARSSEGGEPGAIFGADLRGAIWRDHLTLVLPASIVIGDPEFATLQLQPGAVGTIPLSDRHDLSLAARRHLFVQAPDPPIWSCNVGLGLALPWEGWVLRPELGFMFDDDAERRYTGFGVGLVLPPE
jgi:hypothetical protein